jgi:hypothetical protein
VTKIVNHNWFIVLTTRISKVIEDNDGYTVAWRYVVRGGGWVLLHDINAGINNGDPGYGTINWWFVRRSAFGVLCKRGFQGIPGASACAPDN